MSVALDLNLGRDRPFDDGWLFHRGEGEGLEAADLNDRDWREVCLPHDWSIEDAGDANGEGRIGSFCPDAIGGTATGFSVGGEGWYRRHLQIAEMRPDVRLEIAFDGIHLESDVWINGTHVGGERNGYVPFHCDLTPHLRSGDNVIAVRVRNNGRNSRWYTGSGIYRQVKLNIVPAIACIGRWGVAAYTSSIECGLAKVDIGVEVEGDCRGLELRVALRDPAGSITAEARSAAKPDARLSLEVGEPALWSPDAPHLYSLETELVLQDSVIDRLSQPFGIRIVSFDQSTGLCINGVSTVLRGGCIHHDNGILGARAFAEADERRIRLLKARGYNALRSAHNPSSRVFREACDKAGMLLVEEAFDMWHEPKEPDDFSTCFRQDWRGVIEAMVRAARSSPSVIMWSIGNEIPFRASEEGVEWQWKLANAVHEIDPTRPVTAAINGVLGPSVIAAEGTARPGRAGLIDEASTVFLDVVGYNYRLEDIEAEQAGRPHRIVYGSETYAREACDYARLAERAPWFLGEFVWTAMDYLGEAGLGASAHLANDAVPYVLAEFPWINAWCGDLDLIGNQKAPSYYRDVVWGVSDLEIAVQTPMPEGHYEWISNWGWSDETKSWSWPGHEGEELTVRVYTSGDHVELVLNGKSFASRVVDAADKMRAEFTVPYSPGTLQAVASRAGKEIARTSIETAGPPASLRIVSEPVSGLEPDMRFLQIEIVDDQSCLVIDADRDVTLEIPDSIELLAFGNGGPWATGSFQETTARTYRGRLLAVVRTGPHGDGKRITARATGLESGSLS